MRFFRNKLSSVWLGGLGLVLTFWIALTGSSTIQNALARIDTLIFDGYQQAKPRQWGGSPVVVLDIDEASLAALGQWPWPRTTLAKLTRRLGELGAAVTVFDMVFAEQDRTSVALSIERLRTAGVSVTLPATLDRDAVDHDQIFAKAIAEHRVVTGMVLASGSAVPPKPKAGTALSGNFPEAQKGAVMTAVRNLDLFDAAALGVGDFSFETRRQADAVVRYAPLLRPGNGQFYPSLAVEALRVAQGAGAFVLKMSDGSGEVSGGRSAVVSVRVGALTIPTHEDGSLLIYHSRASSKPVFSAARLLAQQPSREETAKLRRAVEGRIVLVGTSAAGLLDLRATPIEPVVPGVSIHADIIDQVLSGAYLTRPDWILGLEWFVAVVGVLILLATLPFLGAVAGTLLVMVLIAGSVAGFWFLFAQQALVGSPLLASASLSLSFVGATAANLLITERQRHRVRTAFGRYLSPTMVERLANQPDELTLGGEEKELTLLFCDIRGFTSLSEGLQPTELTELLNRFLTPMTTALLERGATIDKYMGDAIMAFWNAPLP
ncbi:MAG: adenylate/guanylate cyclase domain-containing protein, partial [Pseudomonadota bacterium]